MIPTGTCIQFWCTAKLADDGYDGRLNTTTFCQVIQQCTNASIQARQLSRSREARIRQLTVNVNVCVIARVNHLDNAAARAGQTPREEQVTPDGSISVTLAYPRGLLLDLKST